MREVILLLAFSCALAGQTPGSAGKKSGQPAAAMPLEESIRFDETTQGLLVTSNGRAIQFLPENRIQPVLSLQFTRTDRTFAYSYTLGNGVGAKQDILSFAFECRYPGRVTIVAPAGWIGRHVPPELDRYRTLSFSPAGDDNQVPLTLAAGKSAGPFQLTSSLHPGLIRAFVQALPPQGPSTEPSLSEKLRLLSPLAYQTVSGWLSSDIASPSVLTVGPRTPPEQDSLSAIRMELAYAAGQPEFTTIRDQLGALARSSTRQQLLAELKPAANDALPSKFIQALLWRLETLKE